MLITLSGIDGSGKSSLATKLETELIKKGKKVIQMEFPYSKNWLLLENLKKHGRFFGTYGVDNSYIGYVMNFERLAYIFDFVIPNLECYDYVILQRYFIDFAAIGLAQTTNEKEFFLLLDMYNMIKCNCKSYCIDISHEVAYKRICQRGLSCDLREEKNFHRVLAQKYKKCLNDNCFNNYILDGEKTIDELANIVLEDVL